MIDCNQEYDPNLYPPLNNDLILLEFKGIGHYSTFAVGYYEKAPGGACCHYYLRHKSIEVHPISWRHLPKRRILDKDERDN